MTQRLPRLLLIAGLVAAGSCSSPFSNSGGPTVALYFAVQPPTSHAYVLRTQVGGDSYQLVPDSILSWTVWQSVRADNYGTMPIRVTLFSSAGDSVVAVSLSQNYEHGFGYSVSGILGRIRPYGVCAGTVTAVPLAPGSSDTLYVETDEIENGAVC